MVTTVVVSDIDVLVVYSVELVVLPSDVLLATVELVVTFDGDRLGLDVGPSVGD